MSLFSLSPLVHIYHLLKVARVLFLLAFFRSFIRSFLSSLYSISLYSTIYIYCGGPPIRDLQYELVGGAFERARRFPLRIKVASAQQHSPDQRIGNRAI